MSFDLEKRTENFGGDIIDFCKKIKKDTISTPLISQLVRSGTSIGANYCEANGASSKKDFRNKIYICKKEAQETKHWLKMLIKFDDNIEKEAMVLWKEVQELTLIFGKIVSTLNNKN